MKDCKSIFGHKFQPIYDIKEYLPEWINGSGMRADSARSVKTYEKTYVYSICKRCGETVKR